MYDATYPAPGNYKKPLAMCWMAHRGTNEMLAVYLYNRAKNYDQFVDAILHFECPGQNMAYADRAGNIGIWGQGQFVNKWRGQGRFIMDGSDSATLWKELIPMRENPHVFNPAQGYVASANQCVTDSTYPYWYNGYFTELRAWRINNVLSQLQKATIPDMFALQQDTYSTLASQALPVMLRCVRESANVAKDQQADKELALLSAWDYNLSYSSPSATLFQRWWDSLYHTMWDTVFKNVPDHVYPLAERTMQLLNDTSINLQVGNKPFREFAKEATVKSFNAVTRSLANKDIPLWYMDKNTTMTHLAKLPAFSYDHLKIGGWGNTVNAVKGNHGPSWRMVVQMGKDIEAYGVYPGGQSGNPGSKYYASFLPDWTEGKYYQLQFLPDADMQDKNKVKYVWHVHH
jgi:penicillin amidase